jgi:hypothetical protein
LLCLDFWSADIWYCKANVKLLTSVLLCSVRTILTHFSQRYSKFPAGIDAHAQPWTLRPLLAFDGMVVPFSQLPDAPRRTPALEAAFREDEKAAIGEQALV